MTKLSDEFLWNGKTFSQCSTLGKLQDEIRGNHAEVQHLTGSVLEELRRGVDQLPKFRQELRYQHTTISQALTALALESSAGFERVGDAIDRAAYSIGAALMEVQWSVERHRETTRRVHSNSSVDLFEQGLTCYEVGYYNDAETCFKGALRDDPRNYLAAGYLGMLAVIRDDEIQAEQYFGRALDFAEAAKDLRHQALSSLHLAYLSAAKGQLFLAVKRAKRACELQPACARFVYEHARLQARIGETSTAINELRSAIALEQSYWTAPLLDPSFRSMREQVTALLEELRNERREQAFEQLAEAKKFITERLVQEGPVAVQRAVLSFDELIGLFLRNNFFQFPAVSSAASQLRRSTMEGAV